VNDTLYNQLNDSYYNIASVVNTKSTRIVYETDPVGNDDINATLDLGDIWINSKSNNAWIMTSRVSLNVVTWTKIT
jgi:hypothetical protein